METKEKKQKRVKKILGRLKKKHPNLKCFLIHQDPFQLLIATILSAQCTDKRVNMVTPGLFKKYKTVPQFAQADPESLGQDIRSTGFYRNKAKNIIACAKALRKRFKGKVPKQLEDLITLPGIGRKTANVVLGQAFDVPGLAVDTHMIRLNGRLGMTRHRDPVKIEFDLMEIVPRKDWTQYSNQIILLGRERCFARKPDCTHCEIRTFCPSADKV